MTYSLAGAATLLADMGWHVFPLAPGAKVPARGSAGQNDATDDVETVLRWWTDEPNANIGVHCRPSGLYVVDLDRHDPAADGVATWRGLLERHGHVATYTVATAGGGYHLYFRPAPGADLRNTAGKIGPGVDTRGNGYVVAPPSIVNGRPYASTVPRHRIAPLPQWVADAVAPPRPVVVTPSLMSRAPADADAVTARLHDLADTIARAPDGQGNATAAQLAYMAGQYVGAGQVSTDHAASVLAGGLAGWTWRNASDHRTMLATIARQIEAGTSSPRQWT